MDPDFEKLQKMLNGFDDFYTGAPEMTEFAEDKTRKVVSDLYDILQEAYDILHPEVYRINPDRCAKCTRVHKGECELPHCNGCRWEHATGKPQDGATHQPGTIEHPEVTK